MISLRRQLCFAVAWRADATRCQAAAHATVVGGRDVPVPAPARYIRRRAPIAQLAEAADLKSVKCRFESDWGHGIIAVQSVFFGAVRVPIRRNHTNRGRSTPAGQLSYAAVNSAAAPTASTAK